MKAPFYRRNHFFAKAHTLIEMMIVVSVMGLVFTNVYPYIRNSRTVAIDACAEAAVTALNNTAYRIFLAGDTNPILKGSDKTLVLSYYIDNGYLSNGDKINLHYVALVNGVWVKDIIY